MNPISWFRRQSRATKSLLLGALLLLILAASGLLRANSDIAVSSEEAVEIARIELDFEPETTAVKLVREGIALNPVWAVSFSVPGSDGREFERLTVAQVDARSGELISLRSG